MPYKGLQEWESQDAWLRLVQMKRLAEQCLHANGMLEVTTQ